MVAALIFLLVVISIAATILVSLWAKNVGLKEALVESKALEAASRKELTKIHAEIKAGRLDMKTLTARLKNRLEKP